MQSRPTMYVNAIHRPEGFTPVAMSKAIAIGYGRGYRIFPERMTMVLSCTTVFLGGDTEARADAEYAVVGKKKWQMFYTCHPD